MDPRRPARERRRTPRKVYQMTLRLACEGSAGLGRVVDLSAAAARVASDLPVHVGGQIQADVVVGQNQLNGIRLVGKVVRVEPDDSSFVLQWVMAGADKSPDVLGHFLRYVLGIEAAKVSTDMKAASHPFRYTFAELPSRPTTRPLARGGADGRPKSRPLAPFQSAPGKRRVDDKGRPRLRARRDKRDTGPTGLGGAPRIPKGAPTRLRGEPPPEPAAEEAKKERRMRRRPGSRLPRTGETVKPREILGDLEETRRRREAQAAAAAAPKEASTTDDRRGRPRITLSVPVTYFIASQPLLGKALNCSRSGTYVEIDHAPPELGSRLTVRLPVMMAGRYHVVMLTATVIRHKNSREKPGTRQGFAVKYTVVDELGNPGIFRHFLSSH